MTWKRARTEEKVEIRKQEIVEAALELFRKNGYENVSLNSIAAQAGFAKSNVYRYFSSREEIFLILFKDLFEKWSTDAIQEFKKLPANVDPSQYAQIWVKTISIHKHLLNLAPNLMISLERNSSFEQIASFKRSTQKLLKGHIEETIRIFPQLNEEDVYRSVNLAYSAVCNLWISSNHNDVLKKVYSDREFKHLKPNFHKDLIKSVEVIVHGLISLAKKRSES